MDITTVSWCRAQISLKTFEAMLIWGIIGSMLCVSLFRRHFKLSLPETAGFAFLFCMENHIFSTKQPNVVLVLAYSTPLPYLLHVYTTKNCSCAVLCTRKTPWRCDIVSPSKDFQGMRLQWEAWKIRTQVWTSYLNVQVWSAARGMRPSFDLQLLSGLYVTVGLISYIANTASLTAVHIYLRKIGYLLSGVCFVV